MRIHSPPFLLAAALSGAALFLAYGLGKDGLEQAHLAVRWTARAGAPLLFLTYSASALFRLWPGPLTAALLKNRRYWGLSFAVTHTVHLAFIVRYIATPGHDLQPLFESSAAPGDHAQALVENIFGSLGFITLYLMTFTSNAVSVKTLGKWWKRLHTMGIHLLLAIFGFAYLGLPFTSGRVAEGLVLAPLVLAGPALRIAARLKAHRRRSALA